MNEEELPRITEARVRVLQVPVVDGAALSFAPFTSRTMILVELTAQDGTVGYGESWANFPSWAPRERIATYEHGVFPLIIDQPIDQIAHLCQSLADTLGPLGRQWGAAGPIWQAISGVELAMWDLRGKLSQMSVSHFGAGRVRDSIPVYASSLGPTGVLEQAERAMAAGFDRVKLKVGFGREVDEENLALIRKSCGPGVTIYVDANQAWTVKEAINMAPILDAYGVEWVEEPIQGDRLRDLESLYAATGIGIATGENLYGRRSFWDYIASDAIKVIQPDVTKSGGLSEVLTIAQMGAAHGKQVIPHIYVGAVGLAATLQLAAVAPAVTAVELDFRQNALRDEIQRQPPRPKDGFVTISDAPGLGVDLDEAALDRFEVERHQYARNH